MSQISNNMKINANIPHPGNKKYPYTILGPLPSSASGFFPNTTCLDVFTFRPAPNAPKTVTELTINKRNLIQKRLLLNL